jgi:hypothetical protein
MADRHRLQAIERTSDVGEDLVATVQVFAARPLDAVEDPHRLGDRLGEIQELHRSVGARLQRVEGLRELLARGFRKDIGGSQVLPPRLERGRVPRSRDVGSRASAMSRTMVWLR